MQSTRANRVDPFSTGLQGVWSSINRNLPGIFANKKLLRINYDARNRFTTGMIRLVFTDGTSIELNQADLDAFSLLDLGLAVGPKAPENCAKPLSIGSSASR